MTDYAGLPKFFNNLIDSIERQLEDSHTRHIMICFIDSNGKYQSVAMASVLSTVLLNCGIPHNVRPFIGQPIQEHLWR